MQILSLAIFFQKWQALVTVLDPVCDDARARLYFKVGEIQFFFDGLGPGRMQADGQLTIVSENIKDDGSPEFIYRLTSYFEYVSTILNEKRVPDNFQELIENSNVSGEPHEYNIVVDIDDAYQKIYDYLQTKGHTTTTKSAV